MLAPLTQLCRGQGALACYACSLQHTIPLLTMQPPSEDLAQWLKGVDKLEHDLVAIGKSQENNLWRSMQLSIN